MPCVNFQKQKGDGPLVSGQEQRECHGPTNKPVNNRSATARRVPPFGLHRVSCGRTSEVSSRTPILADLGIEIEGHPLGASLCRAAVLPRPASPPCPAVPCCASPCLAVPRRASLRPLGYLGFGFDVSSNNQFICRIQTPDIPRARRGEAGQGTAGRGGRAGRGGAGRGGTGRDGG